MNHDMFFTFQVITFSPVRRASIVQMHYLELYLEVLDSVFVLQQSSALDGFNSKTWVLAVYHTCRDSSLSYFLSISGLSPTEAKGPLWRSSEPPVCNTLKTYSLIDSDLILQEFLMSQSSLCWQSEYGLISPHPEPLQIESFIGGNLHCKLHVNKEVWHYFIFTSKENINEYININ